MISDDIFYILAVNIDNWCLLELLHQGSSKEYLQSMFWASLKPMHTPVNPIFP